MRRVSSNRVATRFAVHPCSLAQLQQTEQRRLLTAPLHTQEQRPLTALLVQGIKHGRQLLEQVHQRGRIGRRRIASVFGWRQGHDTAAAAHGRGQGEHLGCPLVHHLRGDGGVALWPQAPREGCGPRLYCRGRHSHHRVHPVFQLAALQQEIDQRPRRGCRQAELLRPAAEPLAGAVL